VSAVRWAFTTNVANAHARIAMSTPATASFTQNGSTRRLGITGATMLKVSFIPGSSPPELSAAGA
jgi:hypothetical protein